jgi:hypothetical protein
LDGWAPRFWEYSVRWNTCTSCKHIVWFEPLHMHIPWKYICTYPFTTCEYEKNILYMQE